MLIKVLKYGRFLQWLLPLLMAFPFLSKEMHLLFDQHDEHPTCQHEGKEHHLHQGKQGSEHCIICDFTFSCFEVPSDRRPEHPGCLFRSPSLPINLDHNYSFSLITYALRGPPIDDLI